MNDSIKAKVISMPVSGVPPATHELILTAIQEKRLLRFALGGKMRVAEPHDYGIHKGSVRLLSYQVSGESRGPIPGWRWIEVARIRDVEVLQRTFPGSRGPDSTKHHDWDALFARVAVR